MNTKRKRVYYITKDTLESFIEYKHTEDEYDIKKKHQSISSYLSKINNFVLPSDFKSLTYHCHYFAEFIDDLLLLPQHQHQEEEELIDYKKICELSWEWHIDIISRRNGNNDVALTSYYANSYFLSWGSFCRLFYLVILKDNDKYYKFSQYILSKHPFAKYIEKETKEPIVITDNTISKYKVSQLWTTVSILISFLYHHQYNKDMKDYMHILFFRYCSLLSISVEEDEDDNDITNELLSIYDDPSYIEYKDDYDLDKEKEEEETYKNTLLNRDDDDIDNLNIEEGYNDYKNISIPINKHYYIKSSYIYDGELIFYNQLRRMTLSAKLMDIYNQQKEEHVCMVYLKNYETYLVLLSKFLSTLTDMIYLISKDAKMRTYISEEFKMHLHNIHIYHGEKEKFKRKWPESHQESYEIIGKFRQNDNLKIIETRKGLYKEMISIYKYLMNKVLNEMYDRFEKSKKDNNNIKKKDEEEELDEPTRLFMRYCGNDNNDDNSNIDIDDKLQESSSINIEVDVTNPNFYMFNYIEYEREIVLLSRICIIQWIESNGIHYANDIKNAFIIEEFNRRESTKTGSTGDISSFDDIDRILYKHYELHKDKKKKTPKKTTKNTKNKQQQSQSLNKTQLPYLIKLVQVYYVIDINQKNIAVYATHFFFEAFFIWLTYIIKYNIISKEKLPKDIIKMTISLKQLIFS